MNHRYRLIDGPTAQPGEPITVVVGTDRVPAGFRWRGRRYAVMAVVATWVEALPWWVGQSSTTSGAGGSTDSADGSADGADGGVHRQRWVWRVEAARVEAARVEHAHIGAIGVYDLYQVTGDRDADQVWGLARVID